MRWDDGRSVNSDLHTQTHRQTHTPSPSPSPSPSLLQSQSLSLSQNNLRTSLSSLSKFSPTMCPRLHLHLLSFPFSSSSFSLSEWLLSLPPLPPSGSLLPPLPLPLLLHHHLRGRLFLPTPPPTLARCMFPLPSLRLLPPLPPSPLRTFQNHLSALSSSPTLPPPHPRSTT